MRARHIPTFLAALILPAPLPAETTTEANPGNYRELAKDLKPGQVLELAPGRYERGLKLFGLHGREDAPITITGTSARGGAVFVGRKGTNTIDLNDASWIVLRGLEFDGGGLPVDAIKAGGKPSGAVHHVTIEGCTIKGHGAHQNIVGISTKVPAWDWVIRGNTIIGAGTGIYLGNSDGRQPFVGGLIEHNVLVNPVGYCMQIKHQIERPSLEGLGGSAPRVTTIRRNLFIKDDRKSDAGNRPNLLVGGFPESGPGSNDRYEIHDNILFHNHRESLFQGTGRIALRDNLFLDSKGLALRVMPHHGQSPKLVEIRDNAFHKVGGTVRVSGLAEDGKSAVEKNLEIDADAAKNRLRTLSDEIRNPALKPFVKGIAKAL